MINKYENRNHGYQHCKIYDLNGLMSNFVIFFLKKKCRTFTSFIIQHIYKSEKGGIYLKTV